MAEKISVNIMPSKNKSEVSIMREPPHHSSLHYIFSLV